MNNLKSVCRNSPLSFMQRCEHIKKRDANVGFFHNIVKSAEGEETKNCQNNWYSHT